MTDKKKTYVRNWLLDNFRYELRTNNIKKLVDKLIKNELNNIKFNYSDIYSFLLEEYNINILEYVDDEIPAKFFQETEIETIVIPNNIKRIKNSTFNNCTRLKSITIPESVTDIGEEAFRDCKGLINITIPESITNIGEHAFYGCTQLNNISYDSKVFNTHGKFEKYFAAKKFNKSKTIEEYIKSKREKSNIENDLEAISEAMTRKEILVKHNVLKFLREDGFPTFADYLDNFHFNFLTSAQAGRSFVAAIDAEEGVVLINPYVDADGISMILRHEAGHVIFKHMEHMFAKLKELGIDTPSELAYMLANIAGDYHISNELYDEYDYKTAKHIKIENNEEFAGLVTELDFPDHPEYWQMDFDKLWDVFVKDYDINSLAKQVLNNQEFSEDYIEGWNEAIDSFNSGKLTIDDIKEWIAKNSK